MGNLTDNLPVARGPAEHEIRDQIIAAATEHFSLYGYQKTTVSELAKAIGFSKAYIYKFFDSKRAIGEMICANRLEMIIREVDAGLADISTASHKLCFIFKQLVTSEIALFFHERQLYDIVSSAAIEEWPAVTAYGNYIKNLIKTTLQQGRDSGEFERVTDLEQTSYAVHLLMAPYLHPLQLQFNLQNAENDIEQLSRLMLRSLQVPDHQNQITD